MINPDLERRYADCTVLVEEWGTFLDLMNRALRQVDTVSPQLEAQFLACKARIAMLHDSLMESLKSDKGTGNKMLEIVNRSITIKAVQKMSEPEQKKVESEWHECFLLLNETLSALNEERIRLSNINEYAHKAGVIKETILATTGRIVTSIAFKFFATVFVLLFVIIGIQAFGIYDYDKLRDIKQLRPVVKLYLGTVRLVGIDMAYYEIGDVTSTLMAPNPDLAVKQDSADFNLERAADVFAGYSYYNNSKIGELLKGCQSYDRLTYNNHGDETRRAQTYIFWYRKAADARAAAREARVGTPDTVYVEVASNVLILIQSQEADLRDKVRNSSIRKL